MSHIRVIAVAAGLALAAAGPAAAQFRWTVDKKSSLAWWQVNPHMNHLWATTCPAEPSWRPGEGRSGGWSIAQAFRPAKHGDAGVSDTTIVPLYPRRRVRSVCVEAVDGGITASDTTRWRGVRGEITVRVDALITGEDNRDEYTREKILSATNYPEAKFRIDSVIDVSRSRDTLKGKAIGVLFLRGVETHTHASIKVLPEGEDGMRVLGRIRLPAADLISVYNVSRFALGLGVAAKIWEDLFLGVDLVLRPSEQGSNSSN
jgi:polyisoprenoid-binding protein YceI